MFALLGWSCSALPEVWPRSPEQERHVRVTGFVKAHTKVGGLQISKQIIVAGVRTNTGSQAGGLAPEQERRQRDHSSTAADT